MKFSDFFVSKGSKPCWGDPFALYWHVWSDYFLKKKLFWTFRFFLVNVANVPQDIHFYFIEKFKTTLNWKIRIQKIQIFSIKLWFTMSKKSILIYKKFEVIIFFKKSHFKDSLFYISKSSRPFSLDPYVLYGDVWSDYFWKKICFEVLHFSL